MSAKQERSSVNEATSATSLGRATFSFGLVLIVAAALLLPGSRKAADNEEPALVVGSIPATGCARTRDVGVMTDAGDPHGFFVFAREGDVGVQAERCDPQFAQAPDAVE